LVDSYSKSDVSMLTFRFLVICLYVFFFFFFSSRRRHTRFKCDWSSDVCSSDLPILRRSEPRRRPPRSHGILPTIRTVTAHAATRSEERRVGKECRSRWSP